MGPNGRWSWLEPGSVHPRGSRTTLAPAMAAPGSPRFVLKLFATLGVIFTGVGFILLMGVAVRCSGGPGDVPDKAVLELRLDRALAAEGVEDPLSQITGKGAPSVLDVVQTLDRAIQDDRVVGLVAYFGAADQGMARNQELREAIERFRASGKFAVAFADSFGELGPGNGAYYLATAFDEVWLQPTGAVGLTGMRSEAMFVKGTFELLDVQFEGDHRREYKNAFNMYTERRFTQAHKEAVSAILEDLYGQLLTGIAERRGLSVETLKGLIDEGPFLGPEALEAGLVDKLAYRDQVIDEVKERAGKGAELLYLEKYKERVGKRSKGEHKLAVIYGVGGVTRGASQVDPLTGSATMGSDTVTAAFRAAIEDEDVKAIVFRVDSPGGSAVASDSIWRETVRAKEAGKPVIVSMGNVAGSGGYYVAAAANKIVAQPGTITGSIGVLGGKPNMRGLYNKFGVTWDSVGTSQSDDMFSSIEPYDEHGKARLQAWLDWVYEDFKQRVAEGRGMSAEEVEKVARGRIWSGERAKTLGLVDALGGMQKAVELAKAELELGEDDTVELVVFPPKRNFIEQLLGPGSDSSEDFQSSQAQIESGLTKWQPVLQRLEAVGLGPEQPGALTMMPIEIQ